MSKIISYDEFVDYDRKENAKQVAVEEENRLKNLETWINERKTILELIENKQFSSLYNVINSHIYCDCRDINRKSLNTEISSSVEYYLEGLFNKGCPFLPEYENKTKDEGRRRAYILINRWNKCAKKNICNYIAYIHLTNLYDMRNKSDFYQILKNTLRDIF